MNPQRDEKAAREVQRGELPKCVGTPMQPCGVIADPAIKGYDDRYRCFPCNDIHSELVFQESGDSAPGATKPRFISVKEKPEDRARINAIIERTENALQTGEPLAVGGEHLDDVGAWRDANRIARMAEHEHRMRSARQVTTPQPPPQRRLQSEALKAVLRKHKVIA